MELSTFKNENYFLHIMMFDNNHTYVLNLRLHTNKIGQ